MRSPSRKPSALTVQEPVASHSGAFPETVYPFTWMEASGAVTVEANPTLPLTARSGSGSVSSEAAMKSGLFSLNIFWT